MADNVCVRGLRDKRVLVTGGASGIGRAAVARFLEEGCRVASFDRDARGNAGLREELGPAVTVLDVDVSDARAVVAGFERLDQAWGGLDVLVNNAGISLRHRFLDIDPADWRRVLATNLEGIFLVGQQAARRMQAGAGGVILNMGSMNGVIGCPLYADYNASKAGVSALTRTMALELAPKVRVICLAPGAVRTPMQEAEYTPAMFAGLDAKIPLRRHARPEEIAAFFAFLASDEAPYVTGQTIVIDGGESAGGLASHVDDGL
jgi:meso-butanediol dehydrogenase/(S,S)-butanediol dehydrogenase/diacetyl reductase